MKTCIAFNIWHFHSTRSGGMAYYALALLREFSNMIGDRLIVFYSHRGESLAKTVTSFAQTRHILIENPAEIYRYRTDFDVLFTPTIWSGVNMLDYPLIHVLPDIQEQYYPEFFSEMDLMTRSVFHPLAAKASTFLITKSHYSKDSIVNKFKVPETQIRVTYDGVHPIFSDDSDLGVRPLKMPESIENFVFYPAQAWKHKNHVGLLDALVRLKQFTSHDINLILTGHLLEGEYNSVDLHKEILTRGLQGRVFHLGTVTLSELKYLYLNCRGLVHPSLFEGFGIPLAEAMNSGCPIVASNRTSIPEVCGEAALYFNPDEPLDIAQKIAHLLECESDVDERVRIGRLIGKKFSDRKTALQTLDILEEAHSLFGRKTLKTLPIGLEIRDSLPLITLLFVFDSVPELNMKCRINKLLLELNNNIQVIAIVPDELKAVFHAVLGDGVHVFSRRTDLPGSFSEISDQIRGKYLYVSNGKSLFHLPFFYYLNAYQKSLSVSAQILAGDSFLVATDCTLKDSPVPLGIKDEEFGIYCCSNLSFIIETGSFKKVAIEQTSTYSSLEELASILWRQCSKKRIYSIVQLIFEQEYKNKSKQINSSENRIRSFLNRIHANETFMNSRIIVIFMSTLLNLYLVIPPSFRSPWSKKIRRLLAKLEKKWSRDVKWPRNQL